MPYITFTEHPNIPGRQYRDACTDPGTSSIACEVDEVLDGETEIKADEHARIKAAAAEYAASLPPPAVTTVPAPNEFKLAAYAYLGAVAFVAPLSGYIAPTLDALNAGNWALARQIIGYAAQAKALTTEQYAHLNSLMAEYGIPEA